MKPDQIISAVAALMTDRQKAREKDAELLAPEFSIFDYLDRRENGLSRVLACLLDPAGNHGQGDRFLKAFFEWLGLGKEWTMAASAALVWTELPTATGSASGYIDILIRCGGRALAIENKPRAADQSLQVARYLDDLAHSCRDGHCLLYLSRTGEGPSAASIPRARARNEAAAGTLVIKGYPALIEWLKTCLSLCRAPPVSAILDGFIRHIRKDFMGISDVKEVSALVNLVCRDVASLEPALAIVEAGAAVRAELLARTIATVREEVARRKGWHVLRADLGPVRYSTLAIGFAARSSLGFGFAFDTASYGWIYYGVTSLNSKPLAKDVKRLLKEDIIVTRRSSPAWPLWKLVGPNDPHFPLPVHADRQFWLAASDGTLAKHLIDYVAAVERRLRDGGMLTAVRAR